MYLKDISTYTYEFGNPNEGPIYLIKYLVQKKFNY